MENRAKEFQKGPAITLLEQVIQNAKQSEDDLVYISFGGYMD